MESLKGKLIKHPFWKQVCEKCDASDVERYFLHFTQFCRIWGFKSEWMYQEDPGEVIEFINSHPGSDARREHFTAICEKYKAKGA